MRQLGKKRRSIGIRGQMMWFLCLICLLLLGLFWFLSTQLLEPLYTKHIQKQLTAEAEMIVAEMDDAIARGEILSYWAFGGIKVEILDIGNQRCFELRDIVTQRGALALTFGADGLADAGKLIVFFGITHGA